MLYLALHNVGYSIPLYAVIHADVAPCRPEIPAFHRASATAKPRINNIIRGSYFPHRCPAHARLASTTERSRLYTIPLRLSPEVVYFDRDGDVGPPRAPLLPVPVSPLFSHCCPGRYPWAGAGAGRDSTAASALAGVCSDAPRAAAPIVPLLVVLTVVSTWRSTWRSSSTASCSSPFAPTPHQSARGARAGGARAGDEPSAPSAAPGNAQEAAAASTQCSGYPCPTCPAFVGKCGPRHDWRPPDAGVVSPPLPRCAFSTRRRDACTARRIARAPPQGHLDTPPSFRCTSAPKMPRVCEYQQPGLIGR